MQREKLLRKIQPDIGLLIKNKMQLVEFTMKESIIISANFVCLLAVVYMRGQKSVQITACLYHFQNREPGTR